MKAVDAQFLSDQIMIIDFGIAFLSDSSSPDIGTPKSYCAPEFLFSKERSVNSDIWALGCTIFEIRTGSRLFRYKGRPTRTEMLETMVKEMGTLPQIYWAEWPDGRDWYKTQRKEGGELADAKDGTLSLQIMEVGLHDGNYPATSPSGKKRKKGSEHHAVSGSGSSDHENSQGKGTTSRLIALVGEITTSEAAEVINELNNPSLGSQGSSSKDDLNPDSAGSNPISGSGSGSGSGTKNNSGSGTSNAKSGEKSISSEGISIGGSTTLAARVMTDQAENVIGDDASGARVSFKDATATAIVIEFLEPTGTRISVVEAKGLENLLRKALMYLPEERMPPSELAKHHWFFDDFKA
jgi:serine/threonine-protein kinase SRPK3